jgi:hypothetical protein
MNVEKSKIKMLVARDIGQKLESQRDKADHDIYRFQGATTALNSAEKELNAITQKVRDELLDPEKDLPFDPSDKIEVGKYIVDKLMAASKKLHDLADGAAKSALRAEGIKQGYEAAVKEAFVPFEEELKKVEAFEAALASGQIVIEDGAPVFKGSEDDPKAPRPAGTHPGPSLKTLRQNEVAASKGNGKTGPAKPSKKKPKKKVGKKRASPKKAAKKAGDASNA